MNPLDRNGALLRTGDRVVRSRDTGIVMRAEGALINVRLDSTGEFLATAANLWAKDEATF